MNSLKEMIESSLHGLPVNTGNALVEAGHIYAGEGVTPEAKLGMSVGKHVAMVLGDFGFSVQKMLFVDDYNNLPQHPDIATPVRMGVQACSQAGFSIDHVAFESELIPQADKLIGKIAEKDGGIHLAVGKARIKLLADRQPDGTYSRSVDLGVFRDKNGEKPEPTYTCAALDAACYVEKSGLVGNGGLLVTVLPKSYITQQSETKAVLKAAGIKLPILEIYYGGSGEEIEGLGRLSIDFDY